MSAGADGFPAAFFLRAAGSWLLAKTRSEKPEANSSRPEALPSNPSPEVRAQDFGCGLPLGVASLTPAGRLTQGAST